MGDQQNVKRWAAGSLTTSAVGNRREGTNVKAAEFNAKKSGGNFADRASKVAESLSRDANPHSVRDQTQAATYHIKAADAHAAAGNAAKAAEHEKKAAGHLTEAVKGGGPGVVVGKRAEEVLAKHGGQGGGSDEFNRDDQGRFAPK